MTFLTQGTQGPDVARLHDALAAAGFEIADTERAARQFGATTAEAVRRVQTLTGLEPTGVVDDKTWAAGVGVVEKMMPRPGQAGQLTRVGDSSQGFVVSGLVSDKDGNPLPKTTVIAYDVALRTRKELGRGQTGADGRYSISYSGPAFQHDSTRAADLQVQVLDAAGAVLFSSDVVFHAPQQAVIDVPLGGPSLGQPSEFTRVHGTVTRSLGTLSPADITEDAKSRDLTFLAGETSLAKARVALYAAAWRLHVAHELPPELFYALFRMNVPADAATAVLAATTAGVDVAGNAQRLLDAALAASANARAHAVAAAVAHNVIPASYAARQAADLDRLTALAGNAALQLPHGLGKTPIADVLTAAAVPADRQKLFVTALAAATGPTRAFWKGLYEDSQFTKAEVANLRFSVNVGRFTKGHLPLFNALAAMRNSGKIKGARDLARLNKGQWLALLKSNGPDGKPIGVPPNFTARTPLETLNAFAQLLERNLERAYPTTAFSARLAEDAASALPAKAATIAFLDANPGFTLLRSNVDRYLKDNPGAVAPGLRESLLTSQRLLKLTSRYAVAKPLLANKLTSARQIYAMGQSRFVAQFGANPDIGPAQAAKIFARAEHTYAWALSLVTRLNVQINGRGPAVIGTIDPKTAPALKDFPNLQTLFGSLDYCACEDCLSVLSPAAYLVDLLYYLSHRAAQGGKTAKDVLLARRPDLTQVLLNCPNSTVVLPYIDLVNELLESAVAPADPAANPRQRQTTLTTPELNANPQYVNASAYNKLKQAVYPWVLPLDLPLAEARVYLGRVGVERARLMTTFQPPLALPSPQADALAVEVLGTSPHEADIITGGPLAAGETSWGYWGLDQNTNTVRDPVDHNVVVTGGWLDVLSHVRILLSRASLSFAELSRLLNTRFVNGDHGLAIQSQPPASCDLGGMTLVRPIVDTVRRNGAPPSRFAPLTSAAALSGASLDRLHRFTRLWRRLGWDVYDVDAAVEALQPSASPSLGQLNNVLLRQLAAVKSAMAKYALTAQQAAAFFGPLDTRDVPVMPGDEPRPSLYHQLFQNLTVLNPVDPVFTLNTAGDEIAAIGSHPKLADHRGTLTAALQLADTDLTFAIASFTDGALKVANLGALYRNVLLANALGLELADFVSLKALVETPRPGAPGWEAIDPFDAARPERLAAFADAADLVRRSGLAVARLDYLLRHVAAPSAGVAPDDTVVGTLLKLLRDGLLKIAAENTFAPDPGGVETRRRLSAVLAAADVNTAMGILAGASPLTAPQQTAFVTATLGPFLHDPAAAAAALVGGAALPAGAARYEYVLKDLLAYQRRTRGTGLVINDLGVALALPSATAAVLLTAWFPSQGGPAQFLIKDFLALPDKPRDPGRTDQPVTRDEPGFGPYFDAYAALDKAASVIGSFRLTADETAWLRDAGVAQGWLDLTKLPQAPRADAGGLFVPWARLAAYAATRDGLPAVTTPLTALFDLARTGSDKKTYLTTLAARTRWALADLRVLCGDENSPADHGLLGLTYPDDYRAERAVARLKPAFDLIKSSGVPADVGGWIGPDVAPDQADAIKKAVKAKYSTDQWPAIAKPLRDALRERQRDALVAYLLAHDPPAPGWAWRDPDDVYAYYLIDVEMGACGATSRIVQASAAVQLFVQRCFLNLEPAVAVDAGLDADWLQWQWMSRYRLWEANRKVFLYPENWIDPELRRDKSPFFKDLENELLQSDLSKSSAETAFANYLEKLGGVARLDVVGTYHDVEEGVDLLHVIGRTQGTPATYYYRRWVDTSRWTAWTKIDLDISSDHILPVVWNRRLYLFWAIVTRKADQQQDKPPPKPGDSPPPDPKAHLEIQLAWSEYKGSKWQAKQVAPQVLVDPFGSDDLPIYLALKSSFSGPTLRIDVFLDDGDDNLFHIGEFRLGGVGNAVEAFLISSPWARSLWDIGPQTRDIGTLSPALQQGILQPPSQSWFNSNWIIPIPYTRTALNPLRSRVGPLNTTYDYYNTLQNEVVLRQADSYRLLPPHQTYRFDSSLPFFYLDAARQYFVIPSIYYQNGNYFTTTAPAYVYHPYYRAEYRFEPFYHAFVPLFARELNRGGVDALFARQLQVNPDAIQGTTPFDFHDYYQPTDVVLRPFPAEGVDFDYNAGYAIYNWEMFFHAPLLIANALSQNQHFDDARHWYQYIFDPTSSTADPSPQRYWVTKPFFQTQAADYAAQQIAALMQALLARDPVVEHQVAEWRKNPFDPHVIAQLRPVAYQRATVMKYIDNLLAQGDQLFMQYTLESVNEARQCYVMASDLLGPAPVQVPPRPKTALTYTDLEAAGLDAFADAVVAAENALPPARVNVPVDPSTPKLPVLPTLYFCLPPNPQLLAYWGKVADRLFKIRHCMNIQGVVVPLPLLAPPIDPGLLVRAAAAGLDLGSALSDLGAAVPPYRFTPVVRQAAAVCEEVRSLGAELLAALEKRDAEHLALIRSSRERSLQNAILALRARQVDEADRQIDVLAKNRLAVKERFDFYTNKSSNDFMNSWEAAALVAKGLTLIPDVAAIVLEATAGVAHVVPDITVGATGFGGTPHVVVKIGGSHFGHAASGWATASRIASAILHTVAEMASISGGYRRRADDWDLQGRIAGRELDRIDAETAAAAVRKDLTQMELANHSISVQEAADVDDFLHQKFTNEDLYDWMVGQISTVYFQAYQLAYSVAKQAEQCFRRELAIDDTSFITFGYWDSLKKGLLAADKLTFDLRRMEAAYLTKNARELELTRHVSLATFDPYALVELQKTGACTVTLPELFFDLDNPGHYLRRLKTVAVTIPCVVGPYGGVALTLTLLDNHVRMTTDLTGGYARSAGTDPRFHDDPGGTQAIVTSTGQNDSGLFEVSLGDERYLPFEGAGAIGTWNLRLNPVYPQFDYTTITDVILHLRYTARDGGATLAAAAAAEAKAKLNQIALAESRRGLYRLLSARHDYGTNWARFLNPAPGADQVLTIDTPPDRFPFYTNGMDVKVSGVDVIAALTDPGDYTLVITPPGGAPQTVTLSADASLGGAHHWARHPIAPKVDLGRAPAAKPYPSWTIKLQKAGAPDFRSLPPQSIGDLLLIPQFEVS
jgi:hypothetical protein